MPLALLATGCGTRVAEGDTRALAGSAASLPVAGSVPVPAAPDSPTVLDDSGHPGSSDTAGAGNITATTGGQTGAATVGPAAAARTGTSRPAGASLQGGASGTGGAAPSAPNPHGEPPAPTRSPIAATPGSPVKLGSVGTHSGPVGQSAAPMVTGLQVWQKALNAKGGVNGHFVSLLIADDGGDPARHRALVQKLVETDKVLAFIQNGEALSGGKATIDYLNARGVPVIGGDGASQHYYQSPMYFPQGAFGDNLLFSVIAGAAGQTVPEGKKKFGYVVCSEAQICRDAERVWSKAAAALGVEVVYKGQGSLGQPDFTAQCLAARNAGVEVLLPMLDANSISRLSASCARQSYRPTLALTASQVQDRMSTDPNLADSLGFSNVFPYFQAGTPGTDEYQAALARFGGEGVDRGVGIATAWTSGKLYEQVAASLPEPPTTDAILRGLWSLKGETLGGLTQPLTFLEGKNAPENPVCWFAMKIQAKKWVSPDGFKLTCSNR